jgi:DNA-binding transcriptional ArsR family regulator
MPALDLMHERPESNKIIKVLDHPARKRIIELLGARGAMPWKELAAELGMGTGALYYHLDTLEGIVARDASKRYSLTKPGQEVYEYLKANPEAVSIKDVPLNFKKSGRLRGYAETIIAPRYLLVSLTASSRRSILALFFLSGAFAAAMLYTRDEALLLYLTPASGPLVSVGSYLLSLGALILTSYLATLAIFHDRPSLLPLAASSSLSFLPVVIFSLALSAISSSLSLSANRNILTVALVVFQAWSATILAAGISVSSNVRIEKSIMASLIVLYATMILVFVLGSGF